MIKLWDSYTNGNCKDIINLFDGTKIRKGESDNFVLDFPESLDIKITNKCNRNCYFCHENSNPLGKSFSPSILSEKLLELPNYPIELAIGGGDILECKKELEDFLDIMKQNKREFLYRFTFHYDDYMKEGRDYVKYLSDKFKYKFEVGVSISNSSPVDYKLLSQDKVILHIIVGVFPILELNNLVNYGNKVLVLGFKDFGRGRDRLPSSDILLMWEKKIKNLLFEQRLKLINSNFILGFDNLAFKQLNLRSCLLDEEYKKLYLGDDFTSSMYIDAVMGFYSPTSNTDYTERVSWESYSIINFFKEYKNVNNCTSNRF